MESRTRSSERGFTLAGVIVLLTVVALFIAYTVPEQWSKIMARERDKQTIFAMKQYARAIAEFEKKRGALPTTLDQLKESKQPRFLRGKGELVNPLSGEADWIVVPLAQARQPGTAPPKVDSNLRSGMDLKGPGGGPLGQEGQIVGPFVGVRPPKTGKSFLALNGAENYEEWQYTTLDLKAEIAAWTAAMTRK